jgi:hypothetical protein
MIYTFKIGLNEDTLDKEIGKIKVNDILVVKQGINTLRYQVIQVTTNQILTKKLDEKKSDTKTATFTINSYRDGKLLLGYSSNKGKRKVTFSDIKSIELFRNGNKIADIDEISEEVIKKREQEKQEFREKRLAQKRQTNKEIKEDFFNTINSLEIGDDLIISTGVVDEDDEIKKENITEISLKLINKEDDFVFNFIFDNVVGIDSDKYKPFKSVNEIYINRRSFKPATSGNKLVLFIFNHEKEEEYEINDVIDFRKEKSVLKKLKSTKLKGIDIDAIKNNPRLRDALLKNPTLLSKLMGARQSGVLPFELRNKINVNNINTGESNEKFKKGNTISFSYVGKTIKGDYIILIQNKLYAGKMVKDDVIRLSAESKKENIFITIDSKAGDDFYNCTFTVRRMKDGSPVDTNYKGMIKVDDYNF